jgi:hypothetical protein
MGTYQVRQRRRGGIVIRQTPKACPVVAETARVVISEPSVPLPPDKVEEVRGKKIVFTSASLFAALAAALIALAVFLGSR